MQAAFGSRNRAGTGKQTSLDTRQFSGWRKRDIHSVLLHSIAAHSVGEPGSDLESEHDRVDVREFWNDRFHAKEADKDAGANRGKLQDRDTKGEEQERRNFRCP